MFLSDLDMLRDYEKDARISILAYSVLLTEVHDETLRAILSKGVDESIKSQWHTTQLIMSRGVRP